MHSKSPINLNGSADLQPVPRLVAIIFDMAIRDRATRIHFELNPELYAREEATRLAQEKMELDALMAGKELLPPASIQDAFEPSFTIKQTRETGEYQLAPPAGQLFEPIVRVLLNAAEIPYWNNGPVSGEIETINPPSKWRLESEDLTRLVRLSRV